MKNKNLITKGIALSLALMIAGILTACKKDPEDVLSSTESSSSSYNALLNEEFSEEKTTIEETTAEYETLESGETVTNNEGQKVTKPLITAENSNRNVGTQTTTKKASQGQPNGNTTKPDNPAPQPTQPQPTKPIIDPTTTTLPKPTPGDGKITQAQRDYMTNKFIEKALEVGFTDARTSNMGAITGNWAGEVDRVTPETYGRIYDGWMNSGGIEAFHKYQGYNKLYIEWKDCGDYWQIYLQFDR